MFWDTHPDRVGLYLTGLIAALCWFFLCVLYVLGLAPVPSELAVDVDGPGGLLPNLLLFVTAADLREGEDNTVLLLGLSCEMSDDLEL